MMTPDFEKITKIILAPSGLRGYFLKFRESSLWEVIPNIDNFLTTPFGLLSLKLLLLHALRGQNKILEMYIKSDIGVTRESKMAYCFENYHRIKSTL